MKIDHVVLASADLDATAARFFDRYGLASVAGGRHTRWGTANRIVPLGAGYIEFLTVAEPEVGAATKLGTILLELTEDGRDRWFSICVADDDIGSTAARLGLRVEAGARIQPDGTEVRWQGAGIEDPARPLSLPFFIAWDLPAGGHPGLQKAPHRVATAGIERVDVVGSAEELRRWLGGAALPIVVAGDVGDPGVFAVTVALAGGGSLRVDA